MWTTSTGNWSRRCWQDARTSYADLARLVGLSSPSVLERVRRLERARRAARLHRAWSTARRSDWG